MKRKIIIFTMSLLILIGIIVIIVSITKGEESANKSPSLNEEQMEQKKLEAKIFEAVKNVFGEEEDLILSENDKAKPECYIVDTKDPSIVRKYCVNKKDFSVEMINEAPTQGIG